MHCHLIFLPATSENTNYLLQQNRWFSLEPNVSRLEAWKMRLSRSHFPTLERPQTKQTSKPAWPLRMAASGRTRYVLLVTCDQHSSCGPAPWWSQYLPVGENQITGRGTQIPFTILLCWFLRSFRPLSHLCDWLLYAIPCARCWGYSSEQKKQKYHHYGNHSLMGQTVDKAIVNHWVEMHQSLALALLFGQNVCSFASTLPLEGLLVKWYFSHF